MAKPIVKILFLILLLFCSEFARSEEMINLNRSDIYIRSGFELDWTRQLPKYQNNDNSSWLKIEAATSEGYSRSVSVKSDKVLSFLTKNTGLHPTTKPSTFTFVTSFNLNEINSDNNSRFIGLFLSTIGDNWAVYLNGILLRSDIFLVNDGDIDIHRFLRDILIQLDRKLIVDGENILAFKIIGFSNDEATGFYASQSYLIGDYDTLAEKRNNLSSVVLSFTYLILGLFFIFMYLSRTKGAYNLTFGFACLSLFIYLFSRTALIQSVIQNSIIIIKLEYIALYSFSALSLIFFDLILGFKVTKAAKYYLIYTFIISTITAFSDAIIADKILRLWQLSTLFSITYILFYRIIYETVKSYRLFSSVKAKHSSIVHFFYTLKKTLVETISGNLMIGTLIVSTTAALDILNSILNDGGVLGVKYGFFIFMISNTAVLIHKFVTAQTQAEDLTLNLEEKIQQRTILLEGANQALEKANLQSENMLRELEIARDDAKKSSNAKGEFLANMSHEIRTPINGVIGMLRMLRDTSLTKKQQEYSDVARSSADALLSLINDILDFSKIEAGKLEIESITFDLRQAIKKFSDMVSIEIEKKGIVFTYKIESDVPNYLLGDPNRLRQILINLTGNAKKFTSEGSIKLSISLNKSDKHVCSLKFSLKDTGIGIPLLQQQKLFEKFSQADKSTTRKYGGTGLGLSISKQLVEAMEGDIGVESRVGSGSEFWFTCEFKMPVQNQIEILKKQHSDFDASHLTQHHNFSSTKVLVAEDNIVNQMVIKGILKKFDIEAQVVDNGSLAIAALNSANFDIVFMDLQMPVMDGIEATRKIRAGLAGKQNRDIIIIAATANAMKSDVELCLSVGMNDYLSKPILFDEMNRIIHKWLS